MFAANSYRIRVATAEDADALQHLAGRNSQRPLSGRVLIGQINGRPAAALSLSDGRVIGDSSPRTKHVVANLRLRADALRAHETTPSLRQRLLEALPAWYQADSIPAPEPMSQNEHAEHKPVLIAA
jgi:hypothetical protein